MIKSDKMLVTHLIYGLLFEIFRNQPKSICLTTLNVMNTTLIIEFKALQRQRQVSYYIDNTIVSE
jgi:hypothetical protein